MRKMNLAAELKRLSNAQAIKQFSKQMMDYEKRVRTLMKDFNLRGQEARKNGKVQIDEFVRQLKKNRVRVEKKVLTVINQEAKNVNKRCQKLLNNLKNLAEKEQQPRKKQTSTTKRKSASPRLKKSSVRPKTRAKSYSRPPTKLSEQPLTSLST